MQFTIEQSELARIAKRVAEVVPSKPNSPILSAAIIAGRILGNLSVTAGDREMTYGGEYKANIGDGGTIAIQSSALTEAAGYFQAGPIVAVLDKETMILKMTQKRQKLNLHCLDHADYPSLPKIEGGDTVEIGAADLYRVIDQAKVSVEASATAFPWKCSILPEAEGSRIRFVSADGLRMGWSESDYTGTIPRKAMLPIGAMLIVQKMITGTNDDVTIAISERQAVVTLPSATLQFRLLEGDFPDYRQILVSKFRSKIRSVRAELLDTAKRVSKFCDLIAKIRFDSESITITARKTDAGDSSAEIDAKLAGSPLDTGVNIRFLIEALTALESDTVDISFNDSSTPMYITDPDDDRAVFILLPIRME